MREKRVLTLGARLEALHGRYRIKGGSSKMIASFLVTLRWCSDNDRGQQSALVNVIPENWRALVGDVDVSTAMKHVIAGETLNKFWRYNHLPPMMKPRFFHIHQLDGKHYLAWDSQNKHRIKRGENTLDFANISCIRLGEESSYLSRKNVSENSIEIQYSLTKFLRFQCPNLESWKYWLIGLHILRERATEQLKEQNMSLPIHKLWLLLTDQDQTQLTDCSSITSLLSEMQIRCDYRYVRMLCEDPYQIDYLEFEKLMGRLIASPVLLETYYHIVCHRDHMTEIELLDYLSDVQLEVDPSKSLMQLMQAVPAELTIPSGINDVGFCRAMMSKCNSIWDADALRLNAQPMDLSATRYWIKTSYNPCFVHSWTTTKPLSKLQAILRDGYRCIEMDVYEENEKALVIPTSYRPMKFVSVDKVLRVCKECAFKKIHTPFFIFLSIDASLTLCAELGQKLRSIFGKELVQLNEMSKELGDKSEGKLDWDFKLDDFQDRFIIGGKRVNMPISNDMASIRHTQLRHLEFQRDDLQLDDFFTPTKRCNLASRGSEHSDYLPKPSSPRREGSGTTASNSPGRSPNRLFAQGDSSSSAKGLRYTGGHSRLLDRGKGLVALELRQYVESIVLLEQSVSHDPADDRLPSERELDHRTVISGTSDQVHEVSTCQPNRLYKISPLTLLSTVCTPPCMQGWKTGIQMISHFKTLGVAEWIQKGRFLENGRCGYILQSPSKLASSGPSKQKELIIRILGARQLPVPDVNCGSRHKFIVKATLFRDGCADEKRTSFVTSTGLDPRWSDKMSFEIDPADLLRTAVVEEKTSCASLAMLLFEVCSLQQDSANLLCGLAIPLKCIRLGLRWMPLWNLDGTQIPWAGLIVHTETRFLKGLHTAAAAVAAPPPLVASATGIPVGDCGADSMSLTNPPSPKVTRRNSAKDAILEQRRNRRMSAAAPPKIAGQPASQRRGSGGPQ